MNESLRNDTLPDAAALRDNLDAKYAEFVDRANELMATGGTWLQVTSEEEAKQVSDLRKGFLKLGQHFDAMRKSEKEPFASLARIVDGWFLPRQDKLKAELIRLNGIEIQYLQMKEAAERARREEEAARLRKEAEAKLKAAQEEEARHLATQQFQNPNLPPMKSAMELAMVAAMAADAEAQRAEKAALAKPAELSRTRGDLGSVSSLRRHWTGELVDRARLDLEALRDHFATDDLDKAIKSWVRANTGDNKAPPELKGARVYQALGISSH